MKSEKEIKKLAQEIAQLEKIIEKGTATDNKKNVQLAMKKIEMIMKDISLTEGLKLNDAVIEILKNN